MQDKLRKEDYEKPSIREDQAGKLMILTTMKRLIIV